MLELTLEQMDQISGNATIAMHKEFEAMGEEGLKELYGGISTGMVQHVLKACDKLLEDTGNESKRKVFVVTDYEGDATYVTTSKELAEKSIEEEKEDDDEEYFINELYLYGGLV